MHVYLADRREICLRPAVENHCLDYFGELPPTIYNFLSFGSAEPTIRDLGKVFSATKCTIVPVEMQFITVRCCFVNHGLSNTFLVISQVAIPYYDTSSADF